MADKPRGALTDDEWRLLAITFAGSLAAIIVVAVVIGGALALARVEERSHSLVALVFFSVVAAGTVVLGLSLGPPTIYLGSRWRDWLRQINELVRWVVIILAMFLASVMILTWIGIAAQVK
jgi:small-conductance mechanosensitive channel